MIDEELLKLYAADQAERQRFSLIRDENEKENMRKSIQANDVSRRELVAELIPPLTSSKLNAENCFYAATIYSRGRALEDRQKAYQYAKKAYHLAQFKDDDFKTSVKTLYDDTRKKLKNENQSSKTQQTQNTPFQLNPTLQMAQKKRAEEEKEAERLRNRPKCGRCGLQHNGPCPPKPR